MATVKEIYNESSIINKFHFFDNNKKPQYKKTEVTRNT
jgi:hypothetical protein